MCILSYSFKLILEIWLEMAELICDLIYWEDFPGPFSVLLLTSLSVLGLSLVLLKRKGRKLTCIS